jgi:hypothetical protein
LWGIFDPILKNGLFDVQSVILIPGIKSLMNEALNPDATGSAGSTTSSNDNPAGSGG